jgi:hypothetical protein
VTEWEYFRLRAGKLYGRNSSNLKVYCTAGLWMLPFAVAERYLGWFSGLKFRGMG